MIRMNFKVSVFILSPFCLLNYGIHDTLYDIFASFCNPPPKGTPYNNVGIESLQKEKIYRTSYEDFEEAKRALFSYIEGFYNRSRIHSSIDYQTPQELEEKIRSKIT
ncbi:hypothetical protein EGH09_18755 [Brevibacillus laterosporus]|nr:hypothetical protein EGH09_18755 [Brevibacillus laterosporus]